MSQRLASFVLVSALVAATASAQTAAAPPAGPPAQPAASGPPPHTSTGLPADTSTLTSADVPRLLPVLERIKTKMDDWPQLGRYRAANEQLAPAAAGEARVVFLGDSITDNWQLPKFGGFFPGKPYVDQIGRASCRERV